MDVHHPHAEPRRRRDGAGHSVRDVVELEVEEHAIAARHQFLHEGRAVGREEPAANLETTDPAAQTVREVPGFIDGVDVEGDKEFIHGMANRCVLRAAWIC